MKLVMDTGGNGGEIGNFNYFQFTFAGAPMGTGVQLLAAPMNDAVLLAFASTLSS